MNNHVHHGRGRKWRGREGEGKGQGDEGTWEKMDEQAGGGVMAYVKGEDNVKGQGSCHNSK